MTNIEQELESTGRNLIRRLAATQVDSVEEYSVALRHLSQGEGGTGEFAKSVLSVGFRQSVKNVHAALDTSADYYRWLFSLVGVKIKHTPDGLKAQAEPKKAFSEKKTSN